MLLEAGSMSPTSFIAMKYPDLSPSLLFPALFSQSDEMIVARSLFTADGLRFGEPNVQHLYPIRSDELDAVEHLLGVADSSYLSLKACVCLSPVAATDVWTSHSDKCLTSAFSEVKSPSSLSVVHVPMKNDEQLAVDGNLRAQRSEEGLSPSIRVHSQRPMQQVAATSSLKTVKSSETESAADPVQVLNDAAIAVGSLDMSSKATARVLAHWHHLSRRLLNDSRAAVAQAAVQNLVDALNQILGLAFPNDSINLSAATDLQACLEAGHFLLSVFSAPQISHSVVNDEAVDRILNLVSVALSGVLQSHGLKEWMSSKGKLELLACKGTLDKLAALLPTLCSFLQEFTLTYTSLIHLCRPLFGTFLLPSSTMLQLEALKFFALVFEQYPQHREYLVVETATIWMKGQLLPAQKQRESGRASGKRLLHKKTFSISNSTSQTISMPSALILCMLQAGAEPPAVHEVHKPVPARVRSDGTEAHLASDDGSGRKKRGKRGRPRKGGSEGLVPSPENRFNSEGDQVEVGHHQGSRNVLASFYMQWWRLLLGYLGKGKGGSSGHGSMGPVDHMDMREPLEALIEDLLVASQAPEFPAALFLLQSLVLMLDSTLGLRSESAMVRAIAVDVSGQLATWLLSRKLPLAAQAAIKRLLGGCDGEVDPAWSVGQGTPAVASHPGDLTSRQCQSTEAHEGSKECAVCGALLAASLPISDSKNAYTTFCSSCKLSFHVECLGQKATGTRGTSSYWCSFCAARAELHFPLSMHTTDSKSTKNSAESDKDSSSVIDISNRLARHLLLQYVKMRTATTLGDFGARHCFNTFKTLLSPESSQLPETADHLSSNSNLPYPVVVLLWQYLQKRLPFVQSFDALLERILACLKDKPTIRAKAVKALSSLVDASPALLSSQLVRKAVEARFLDCSVSVREAVVDLVGKHIVTTPELALKYYTAIAERIRDSGLSVRIRVIRILRSLCTLQASASAHFPWATHAICSIFSRVSDEEKSVRDMVLRCCRELWFDSSLAVGLSSFQRRSSSTPPTNSLEPDTSSSLTATGLAANASAHTSLSSVASKLPPEVAAVRVVAEQIVAVLGFQTEDTTASSNFHASSAPHSLTHLIRSSLEDSECGEPHTQTRQQHTGVVPHASPHTEKHTAVAAAVRQRPAVRQRCILVCRYLLDRVVQAHEDPEAVDPVPYVKALQVFCDVDPSLCMPPVEQARFITVLLPYTKAHALAAAASPGPAPSDVTSEQLCEGAVRIIAGIVPVLRQPVPKQLLEAQGLSSILSRIVLSSSSMSLVQACLQCLCVLQEAASWKPLKPLLQLLRTFQRALLEEKEVKFKARAAFSVGALLRFGGVSLDALPGNPLPSSHCLSILKSLVHSHHPLDLRIRAMQGLGNAVMTFPGQLASSDTTDLIRSWLSSDENKIVRVNALRFLLEYLEYAEQQAVSRSRLQVSRSYAAVAIEVTSGEGGCTSSDMSSTDAPASVSKATSASSPEVPLAAGTGDAGSSENIGVCTGVVQLHWQQLLDCATDRCGDVRQAALKLIQRILQQGLVIPVTCVPHLIALEFDLWPTNRKLAHRLLQLIENRWSSYRFVENRLGEGLLLAFALLPRLHSEPLDVELGRSSSELPSRRPTQPVQPEDVLARELDKTVNEAPPLIAEAGSLLYSLLNTTRSQRFGLLSALVKLLDSECDPSSAQWIQKRTVSSNNGGVSASFSVFIAILLSRLPFAYAEEPLFLVHGLSRMIILRAQAVMASLMQCSHRSSQSREESFRGSRDAADALMVSICLRKWLLLSFSLSEERCEAYNPADVKNRTMELLPPISHPPFRPPERLAEGLTTAYSSLANALEENSLSGEGPWQNINSSEAVEAMPRDGNSSIQKSCQISAGGRTPSNQGLHTNVPSKKRKRTRAYNP